MNRLKLFFHNVLPQTIYRIQGKSGGLKLRDLGSQSAAGNSYYDLILDDEGHANPLQGDEYKVPNGASTRPLGPNLRNILTHWKGDNIKVIEIPKGTALPEGGVAVQEAGDHFSLQCSKRMKKEEMEKMYDEWFAHNGKVLTRKEVLDKHD